LLHAGNGGRGRPRSIPPGIGPGARGLGSLVVLLALLAIGALLVMAWAVTSGQFLSDVGRTLRGQRAMEVARSALAEAFLLVQKGANDSQSTLYTILRSPIAGPAPLTLPASLAIPALSETSALEGAAGMVVELSGQVTAYEVSTASPGYATGEIRIEAQVTTGQGGSRSAQESRRFRVQRIAVPAPVDTWVLAPTALGSAMNVSGEKQVADPGAELGATDAGRQTLDVLLDPGTWSGLAAYQVDIAKDENQLQAWLSARLDRAASGGVEPARVNGVVYAGPGAGSSVAPPLDAPPQKITGLTFRGKAILVVDAPVHLENVTVADPASDLLSVIAFGTVTTVGPLSVCLVRSPSQRELGQDVTSPWGAVQVTGSLVDLTGLYLSPDPTGELVRPTGTLAPHPHAAGGGGTEPVKLDHLVVLISPRSTRGPVVRG
jgi:hypothetical protein